MRYASQRSEVYSWGSSRNFTLGHTDGENKSRPSVLPRLVDKKHGTSLAVCELSTSQYHTLFLTENGRVYACGFGRGFRLGLGDQETYVTLTWVDGLRNKACTVVAAGRDHSAAITTASNHTV